MNLRSRFSGVATSQHAGRALKAAKVLNFVGTVRGAVTTVLVLAGAAGGAATVTTVVQQDLVPFVERSTASSAPTVAVATPVTAAGIRAKAEATLQQALATHLKAADDLRKIAVLRGAALDQLIADTKHQLQQRHAQGVALIGTLLQQSDRESRDEPPPSVVVVVNALVSVFADDLNQIIVRATQNASGRAAEVTAPPSPAPEAANVSAAVSLRADAEARLQGTLAADQRSIDDLVTGATISGPRLEQLIVDTKGKLRARFDQGIALLDALALDPNAPPTESAIASLEQVITNDLNAITRQGTQLASYTPTPSPTLSAPGVAPPYVPRVVVPTAPIHQPTPAARATTPAVRTPTVAPRTPTPLPPTPRPPTPAPRPATPPPARPLLTH